MEQAEESNMKQSEQKRNENGSWRCECRQMARREEYSRKQMEILQTLAHGVQLQGEAAAKGRRGKDVRVPRLMVIVAMLERLMHGSL